MKMEQQQKYWLKVHREVGMIQRSILGWILFQCAETECHSLHRSRHHSHHQLLLLLRLRMQSVYLHHTLTLTCL